MKPDEYYFLSHESKYDLEYFIKESDYDEIHLGSYIHDCMHENSLEFVKILLKEIKTGNVKPGDTCKILTNLLIIKAEK